MGQFCCEAAPRPTSDFLGQRDFECIDQHYCVLGSNSVTRFLVAVGCVSGQFGKQRVVVSICSV